MAHMPLYKKVYYALCKEIQDGAYQDNDKLPSEQSLAERFSTSTITIKHALAMLSDEGLIKRTPGFGSFVTLSRQEETPAAGDTPFNVGIMMSGTGDAFGTQFICSVCKEARRRNCGVLLGIGYSSQREETAIINQMIRDGARGIIIMPLHAQSYNIELLRHVINGYPLVLADRTLEGLNIPFVGSNNDQAAYDATRYLLSIGHKRIAFLSPMDTNTTLSARRSGYIRAFAEQNLSLDSSLIMNDIQGTMPEFAARGDSADMLNIQKFIRSHPDVTAIVAADSPIAILTEEALLRIGVRVPQQISIICFDAYDSLIKTSHFTHIKQDEARMGSLSFQRLYNIITGQPVENSTLLDTQLILGRSSLPYPAGDAEQALIRQ